MTIRVRFSILQLIFFSAFLLSTGFLVLRFSQVYRLKKIELINIEMLTELKELNEKSSLFSSRSESPPLLWSEWKDSYRRFDSAFITMLMNPQFKLLGKEAVAHYDIQTGNWEQIQTAQILPFIKIMDEIIANDIGIIAGGIEINRYRLSQQTGIDSPETIRLLALENQFRDIYNALIVRISVPSEIFLNNIKERLDQLLRFLFLSLLLPALVIQIIGAWIGLVFSNRLSHHIAELKDHVSKVADGNFKIVPNIRSGDELADLADSFHHLTSSIWTRLESLKEMMKGFGESFSKGMDLSTLEDQILEKAIQNTEAHAGIFLTVEEDILKPQKMQGYFPPPLSIPVSLLSTKGEEEILEKNLPVETEKDEKKDAIRSWFLSQEITKGKSILGEVFDTVKPHFIRRNTLKDLPYNDDVASVSYINSAIFIPLSVSGKIYAVLGLAMTKQGSVFSDLDYSYMRSYGEFVALTLDNTFKYLGLMQNQGRDREIDIATRVQKTLLPQKIPVTPGIQIAAFSNAAKGVGGDYYDIFDMGEGKKIVVICDVVGKGVPASMLMTMIRTVLRTISIPGKRADQIMMELNENITGIFGAERFATASLMILDVQQKTLSYSNAAHHPLYILRGESLSYRLFDTEGVPLGIDKKAVYGHKKIKLGSKDYLILFTDGIPEARNSQGKELGVTSLLSLVTQNSHGSPQKVTAEIKKHLSHFTLGMKQHDDQTFLAVKID